MTSIKKASISLAFFVAVLSNAHGQATRTWVSGVGDDVNPCSRTAPCKTFAGAISKTAAGGEIDALDPGGFGTLTITKAITIDGGSGQVGSVLAAGTIGFTINAGSGDVVTLKNLTINGINQSTSPGTTGVNILAAKAVHIENCIISNFSGSGIKSNASGPLKVFLDHVISRGNTVAGGTFQGSSSSSALVSVTSSTFENNGTGLIAAGYSKLVVTDTVASGNAGPGFQVDSSLGSATMNVLNSISTNNGGAGVESFGSGSWAAVARMSNVSVFSNGSGLSIGPAGNIYSYGDNLITGGGFPSATLSRQ